MLSDGFLLVITTLIAVFVTVVVSLSPDVRKVTKFVFSLTTLSLSFWNISIFVADSVQDHLMFWNDLAFFWPSIGAVSCLAFVYLLNSTFDYTATGTFPKRAPRWLVVTIVGVGLQFLAIASNKIFESVTYSAANHAYTFVRGIGYPIYIVGLLIILALMFTRLVKGYRLSGKNSQSRRAFRIVAIAIVATALYSVLTNILIPVATGSQKYISLGMFSLDIFSFGLAFSIIRYHFLDIKQYAWVAAAYVSTIALVTSIYALTIGVVVVYLLRINLNPSTIFILATSSTLLAITFHPLQSAINKSTQKLFFRDYYDSQEVLDRISRVLIHSVNRKAIQDQCKSIIEEAVHPEYSEFVLNRGARREKDKFLFEESFLNEDVISVDELRTPRDKALIRIMRAHSISLIVPLRTSHDSLGFLLFGPRRSGSGYSTGDKRFLRLVADQVAIGLQNALHFEEIQRFNATLQEEVDTATLKLKRQNKRLEELDNIKDDFISMASHQLRTPLTSVKGYLSMVIEGDAGKLNDTQEQMLKQAFASSQRMVFLITDLLNVSRLKTGKFVIDAAPTDLSEVVAQELDQLHETAQVKNIELSYQKPAKFPQLMLDEVKIRQVIMNFIDNAIYYTPVGGHIRVELTEKPNTVEFRVIDDGIGVPRSEQHHLFTKFYRATNARKTRPDGTGLGLFMAQKVIVAQGGTILFSSQENKGSTFGFIFSKSRVAVASPDTGSKKSKAAV